ncbi:hypothetical protein, partial [Vibrio parahaemolyticus]|uniref:hypothetical protein n=2 Tax=Vibrio parahaemolyticus TaxID=670 RepID=UPI002D1E4195
PPPFSYREKRKNSMAKTHFHSNPQQRWFKPSASTGVRFAQYGATLGTRYGPQGVVIGGALGFVAGALIGGALDELDVI